MKRHFALFVATAAAMFVRPAASLAWLDPADPDVHVVLNTQDCQFSSSAPSTQDRWLLSAGKTTTSLLKGWQDMTAMQFDLSAFRGRTVQDAELHLCKANTQAIFALVVSTMNAPWNEGNATGTAGVGDPCWRWRSRPADPNNPPPGSEWTFRYSDFTTATLGNFGTLVCYAYNTEGTFDSYTAGAQTWVRMRIDPAVAQALILDQYGLAVTDPRNYTYLVSEPRIYTKEAGTALQPRLYLKFVEAVDTTPPGAVGALAAEPGPENGEVLLRLTAPADPQAPAAFGYTVRYSAGGDFATATDVERWRIPRPKAPAAAQRLLVEDLMPGATLTFFVRAYDAAGNGGPVASVPFTLPPARPVAAILDDPLNVPSPTGRTVREVPGVLRYWAGSEMLKVNPLTGNRMEDGYTGTGADDYKKANVVWDAATNTISLTASRNEVVGCQLFLERLGASLTNVGVTAGDLAGVLNDRIPASPYVEWFRLHYVTSGGYYPDPAIPLAAPFPTTFNIPQSPSNPSGKNQAVWMDLYVPKDAPAGDYTGLITVTAQELAAPVTIILRVRVSALTIPDYPTFLVDLNGYGNYWDSFANKDLACLRYFQAAHKHRAACNTLPYGWAASIRADRAPTLTGAGPALHADDWTTFDNKYGRFFDGSAFRPDTPASPYVGPGMNTPVTHLYTTFFESWPIYINDPTYGFDPPALGGHGGAWWDSLYDTNRATFFTTLPEVGAGWPAGYEQGVRNVVADWFGHAHQKGWTRTRFQIYLNHKLYYDGCTVLWTLEECETADDMRAVGFFHQLYRDGQAMANAPDVQWHFRIDINDRLSQRWGQLDNRINYYMVNHRSASWHWRQIDYRNYFLDADKPEEWNWYNLGAGITGFGTGHMQLFLQKWCQGYTGGLPYWDNYQTAWSAANDLSLVYSGQSIPGFGTYEGPVMSIRVKTMRQAQQVIELLSMLAGLDGWNRSRVRDAISAKYGDHTWDYAFAGMDEVELHQLRADLVAQLEALTVRTGDIDGDGSVTVFDVIRVIRAFGATPLDERYDARADLDHGGIVDIFDVITVIQHFGEGT